MSLVVLVSGLAFSAYSQDPGPSNIDERLSLHYLKLQEFTGISDTQKDQLETISKIYSDKYKILAKEDASRWKKIRKARSIQKAQKRLLKDVLNDEQMEKYDEFMENVKANLKKSRK